MGKPIINSICQNFEAYLFCIICRNTKENFHSTYEVKPTEVSATHLLFKNMLQSLTEPELFQEFMEYMVKTVFPSILSRTEAKITNDTEISHLFSIANLRAVRPKVNEMNVNKLGIKLLKDNFFMLVYKIKLF